MTKEVDVKVMRLPHAADLPLPAYQSALAAGLDLVAAIPVDKPVTLAPGQRAMVPTGLAIALPEGTERRCARAQGSPRKTESACSTRRARSTRIIAEKYKLFLLISARKHFRSRGVCGLHNLSLCPYFAPVLPK